MAKIVLIATLILLLGAGMSAWGRVVGNWETTVTLQPQTTSVAATPMNFAGVSTLMVGYFEGDLAESPSRALSRLFLTDPSFTQLGSALQIVLQQPFMQQDQSRAVFHLEGYHKQEIIFDYPVGTLGVRFDLAFSLGESSLQYLWKEIFVNYGGISLSSKLSLKPMDEGLASGMALKLRGNTFGGAQVEVNSLFGMTTEIEEIGEGIGPSTYPSFTQWKSTEVSLTGLTLDWFHFDSSAKISNKDGYEHTKFDFEIEPEGWPVSFDFTVKFAPQTQSVALRSTLDLEWATLYVYSRGLEIRGFSLPYVNVNDMTFSGIMALKGVLYKSRASDIGLRARNYCVDAALEDPTRYKQTDYVAIFSIEGGFGTAALGIDFAGDVYFKRSDSDQSFDIALLTGEINYEVGLSKQLAFGGGFAIDPNAGLQELVLNIESWFFWY